MLSGIDTERARCTVVALAACAAAGTVRRCAEAATDYIRTREQFGRPIGTFQALQHKAAVLLVNAELAAAAAWDAVRANDESVEQHRLAAASAALMAIGAAPDLVLDALLMFGAIGYTWEHDTHLYWRRATSLAASLGPTSHWSREVGELARTVKRSTTINLADVESEFRARVAGTLDRAQTLQQRPPIGRSPESGPGHRAAARPAGRSGTGRPASSCAVGRRRLGGAAGHPRRGVRQAARVGATVAGHRGVDPADDSRQRDGSAARAVRVADRCTARSGGASCSVSRARDRTWRR